MALGVWWRGAAEEVVLSLGNCTDGKAEARTGTGTGLSLSQGFAELIRLWE